MAQVKIVQNTTDPRITQEKARQDTLVRTLGELGGSMFAEEDFLHEGDKLIIPERMTLNQAEQFIRQTRKREEQETSFMRQFNYRPWDGGIATWNVLKRTFGAVGHQAQTVEGFFTEDIKPRVITIPTGPHSYSQVPWGDLTVPYLPGVVLTLDQSGHEDYGIVFVVHAIGPRKYRTQIEGLFTLIQKELEENSLYRGKAIDGAMMANFIDLSAVDPRKVHYTEQVFADLEANIYSPLRYSDQNRELSLPLKRAILIHGQFGTGKTLAAYLTGQVATENKWTFLFARPGKDDLLHVMQTARLYQPAVVFFEDMDLVASPDGQDGDAMTKMLDIFDGITAKGTEIMIILTTNHPEKIHKGMLRAGRLDAVIQIGSLDRSGIEGMVKSNAPEGKLAADLDYDEIYDAMSDLLPSFVKEAIDRAIRYALARTSGRTSDIKLTTQDFVRAAYGLQPQLKMMEDAHETHNHEALGEALKSKVQETLRETINPRFFAENS